MKSKNKFLDGNWHPVEETSAENLKVSGEIPKELAGLFLRNGPNPKKFVLIMRHEGLCFKSFFSASTLVFA